MGEVVRISEPTAAPVHLPQFYFVCIACWARTANIHSTQDTTWCFYAKSRYRTALPEGLFIERYTELLNIYIYCYSTAWRARDRGELVSGREAVVRLTIGALLACSVSLARVLRSGPPSLPPLSNLVYYVAGVDM